MRAGRVLVLTRARRGEGGGGAKASHGALPHRSGHLHPAPLSHLIRLSVVSSRYRKLRLGGNCSAPLSALSHVRHMSFDTHCTVVRPPPSSPSQQGCYRPARFVYGASTSRLAEEAGRRQF